MKLQIPTIKIDRTWLMLGLAVVLALVATWLTSQYLSYRTHSIETEILAKTRKDKGETVDVVVPTSDLGVGTVLDLNFVASRPVSADFVYEDTILVADFDKYRGQMLIRPVMKGRPLLRQDVRELFKDFAGTVPLGKRAMTIDVDELNSVANMIQPGNLIDLMLVMSSDSQPGGRASVVPFLSRVKVLATGQTITHEEADIAGGPRRVTYSNLTLELDPKQAARVAMAQELGKLRAVLRNEQDVVDVHFDQVAVDNLLSHPVVAVHKGGDRNNIPETDPTGSNKSVEYIIGGKGGGGVGTPLSIPVQANTQGEGGQVLPQAEIKALIGDIQKQVTSQIVSQIGAKKPPANPGEK